MSAAENLDPGSFTPTAEIDLDPLRPVLGPLLRYWLSRRGDHRLPARGDIDPIDIPELLPFIGLIDVEHTPRRFHYRLVGSYMNTLFGDNYQDKYLDEAKHGPYRDFLSDLYGRAVDERRPVLSEAVFNYGTDRIVTVRRLILPLAEHDFAAIGMLLFANIFDAPHLPAHATPVMQLRMDAPFQAATLESIGETFCRVVPID